MDKQWEIRSLGNNLYKSPLECSRFITDEDRVLKDYKVSIDENPSSVLLEKAGAREMIHFDPKETVAGIVTCGGICPAINNVIRSTVHQLCYGYNVKRVIGFKYGFEGLINESSSEMIDLDPKAVRDIHQFGGSVLGTSRGAQSVPGMIDYLVKLKVSIIFCIGGDGTQKGALAMTKEIEKRGLNISVVGIPKTIDNDICYLERTFGFETAVALSQSALEGAHEEARSVKNGIGIVKLMGRYAGFISLHAALASGDVNLLLLPEMKFDMDDVIEFIQNRFKTSNHCLILVSEGAGQDICVTGQLGRDKSGNKKLGDIGMFLKEEIASRLKSKDIECGGIKYIDPSYMIRSAVANPSDSIYALRLGQMAVHAAMAGKTGLIVGMLNSRFVHLPIEKAVEFSKVVDIKGSIFQSFIDSSGMPINFGTKR